MRLMLAIRWSFLELIVHDCRPGLSLEPPDTIDLLAGGMIYDA
jgi:hypothetical protein